MPLYEYQCDACGHRFEKIQKFSDALETVCPKCGGVIHKLFSSPAIQFKGSGFYITDYAKKDHVAAAKADSANNLEGAAKADGKGDGAKSDGGKGDGAKADKASSSGESSSSSSAASASSSSSSTSTGKD